MSTALYVETTGDVSILEEKIPFLEAPPLSQDENERYNKYLQTNETYTLLEHCQRAIEKGATQWFAWLTFDRYWRLE